MISYTCPTCSHVLNIPGQYAGQIGKCNHCGAQILVPERSAKAPDTPPAAQPQSNWAAKMQLIGLSMTGCGCYIFLLPVIVVLLVIAYGLLAAAFTS